MNTVRDRATVRVSETVSGARLRKERSAETGRNSRVTTSTVSPVLMEAARRSMRPGQRLVVVSATVVRIVNV